jgi:hypothetical protein
VQSLRPVRHLMGSKARASRAERGQQTQRESTLRLGRWSPYPMTGLILF